MDARAYDENLSSRHIAEASANYARYEHLNEVGEYGWAVVLLFYSALHLVDAYKCIHHPGVDFRNHEQRDEYVFDELRSIHVYYKSLLSMSRSVRYDLYDCSSENVHYAHGEYTQLWLEMQTLGI